MSIKITGSLKANDPSYIAKQMANNTILQYKMGEEELARQLMGDDIGSTSSDVHIVNPTQEIRVPKQKPVQSVLSNVRGHNALREMQARNTPVSKSNPNAEKAKEFISQTRALDNDIDHALALMKLNNKDEFYKNGLTDDMLVKTKKKIVGDNASDDYEFINEQLDRAKAEYKDANKRTNKGKYDEDELEEMKEKVEHFKEMLQDIEDEERLRAKENFVEPLVEQGLDIERERKNVHELEQFDEDAYYGTTSNQNAHRKSKKGVRIVNQIGVGTFSSDLVLLVKKIANAINVLIPLAHAMVDTRYQGITHADRLMLQEMYQDMDEKLYILTSLNNVDNTSLVKLDKNFDKLYDSVKRGLDSYNGGSMVTESSSLPGPGVYVPPAHTYVNVDNWNYL